MKRSWSFVVLLIVVLMAAGFAGAARADGLPVLGVDVGGSGVASLSGDARYVTLPAGRETVVARVDPRGGRVLASRLLAGVFTIPAVAYDGSAAGLSADGRMLVLIEPRASFPRAWTRFSVLSVPQLRPLRTLRLRGDFSFDAISPRGSVMYLIQYTVPTDPSRYVVRAYDVPGGRLLAEPVIDPRQRAERMRGSPLSRATSSDGRFAFTLYDGAGTTPFIHALDTRHATARCIDLPLLAGSSYLWRLRLTISDDGGTLSVRNGRETEALIDTQTYEVGAPQLAAASARSGRRNGPAFTWTLAAISTIVALALAAGVAAVSVARRRALVGGPPL